MIVGIFPHVLDRLDSHMHILFFVHVVVYIVRQLLVGGRL